MTADLEVRPTIRKGWRPSPEVAFLAACLRAAALAPAGPVRDAALRTVRELAEPDEDEPDEDEPPAETPRASHWPSHCPHGHEFTRANTRIEAGNRRCRECYRQRYMARAARERAARESLRQVAG